MTNFHLNTTVVAIFPNVCLWRRSLCSDLVLTLKNRIEPPSYSRTAYVVAIWPSFVFDSFVIIWATCEIFLGKWVTAPSPPPPPLQKISRTPMVFCLENVIRYQLVNSMYFMKGCYSCRAVVMIISCQVNSASQQAGNQPVNFYFQRISIFCFTMKVIRVTPSGGNSQPQVLIHGRLLCESIL